MASTSQDFEVFQNSRYLVTIDVAGPTGTPLDMSSADDVVWAVQALNSTATQISKRLTDTGTDVTLTNSRGTNDRIQIVINSTELNIDTGVYPHEARVEGPSPRDVPVTKGTMTVERSFT